MTDGNINTERTPGYSQFTDPSTLTTAQLLREISSLKELVFTRLNAIEEGIEVAHQDLVRVPTEVQKQIGSLKELMEVKIDGSDELKHEKFKNIDKRLDLVEQARIEQKKDTATAVDAALKAAKEAVTEQNASNVLAINKSEAAMTKQMDQQVLLISQVKNQLQDQVNDLKALSSKGEGRSEGYAKFIGWILAAIAIMGFVITNMK